MIAPNRSRSRSRPRGRSASAHAPREARHQEALFGWHALQVKTGRYPDLDLMFATLNGAYLHGDTTERQIQWARLSRQGAKPGVWDVVLPVPQHGYHGLWIEMKAPAAPGKRRGTLSADQKQFGQRLKRLGYAIAVAYGYEQAIDAIKRYYGGDWHD